MRRERLGNKTGDTALLRGPVGIFRGAGLPPVTCLLSVMGARVEMGNNGSKVGFRGAGGTARFRGPVGTWITLPFSSIVPGDWAR